MNVLGYAAQSATDSLVPFVFERREPRPDDVVIDGGVIPAEMKRALDDDDTFYVGGQEDVSGLDLGRVRHAMREQRKMRIAYTDEQVRRQDERSGR